MQRRIESPASRNNIRLAGARSPVSPSNTGMKAFFVSLGLIAVLGLVGACSHPAARPNGRTSAPTRLGLLISDADRIVITNRLAPREERYRGFSLTISGDDARGIVKDVAFMSPARGEVTDSYFDWELRFYVGTESLAAIYLASSTFTFEGNEYFGDTGKLKALSGKLLKLTTPPGRG
jgi:hypothetical protein